MKYPKAPLICAAALANALFWACGSPDIAFAPPPDDAAVPEAAPDVVIVADAGVEETSAADADAGVVDSGPDVFDAGNYEDVVERQDAAKVPEGGACPGANPCDCDNDGYIAKGACGGNDCDDRDALRHPNQGFVDEPLEPGKNGDWDCSGLEERREPVPLACNLLGGLNCGESANGFLTLVPCGVTADFYVCEQVLLLGCKATKRGTMRQACK